MKSYHAVWLEAHPDRSESWLKERLLDGFDIHHIDGDRENNAPENLVLIEAVDHLRLHGRPDMLVVNLRTKARARAQALSEAIDESARATYEAAVRLCQTEGYERGLWRKVAEQVGVEYRLAMPRAKRWALANDMLWPLNPKRKYVDTRRPRLAAA